VWAIRYRDAHGRRPQETGFRTKGEAHAALEEALRRVRLGPLYRPTVTLRELTDAFLERHDAAPSTLDFIRTNMRPAVEWFGDEPVASVKVEQIAAWRASLPAGKRYRCHGTLRQVKNPAPKPREIHPGWRRSSACRTVAGSCSRRRRVGESTSTTGAIGRGHRR
jgi:hypothetical protein